MARCGSWYEAICRVAVCKALPTDDEVEAAGFEDAGAFLLALRESPSDYKQWVDDWNEAHDSPIVKATQPAIRCLEHLILLIVRTVEANSKDKDKNKKLSKKEIKTWAGR